MSEPYVINQAEGDGWTSLLGDSCERLAELGDESVDLSIYSPPFASLYTYSPSVRDIGNCATWEEFFEHYGFVIRELFRVTKPGRNSFVHVADISTTKATHGVTGLRDLSGAVIAAHVAVGWPQSRLAERLGWTPPNFSSLIRAERAQVEQRTAAAVAKLYDQLWQVSPEGPSAARARRHAARRGWPGPLAWDDETIDDPAAAPDRGPSRAPMGEIDPAAVEALVAGRLTAADVRPAERYAAILQLSREGRSAADIAAWIGASQRTVERVLAAGRAAS